MAVPYLCHTCAAPYPCHRGPATAPPDALGDGVDLLDGEGHHGGAGRQVGQLVAAGVLELGEARPGLDLSGIVQIHLPWLSYTQATLNQCK